MPRDLAAARHIGRDDRAAEGGGFEQALGQPFPARRQHRDMRALPDVLDAGDMAQQFDAGLCLPAFDFAAPGSKPDWPDRGRRQSAAAPSRHGRASESMRGDQRPHALVIEQPPDKGRGHLARGLRQRLQRIGVDARAGDQMHARRRRRRAPARAARSSGFCTSTAERVVVQQERASAPPAPAASACALGLREVNTKPSPASAFSRATGSPSAASEPITDGCSAT